MMSATASLLAFQALVMLNQPVTVAVSIPENTRHAENVLLRMEGVVIRHDAPAAWNVFWEMPEANARTSVDSLHFVGYVSVPANSALKDTKPAKFTLALPEAAVAAMRRKSTLRLTFVPVRKLPEGGVTIGALRFE